MRLCVAIFALSCTPEQGTTSAPAPAPVVAVEHVEPGTMDFRHRATGKAATFEPLHAGRDIPAYDLANVTCTHGGFVLVGDDEIALIEPDIRRDGEDVPVVVLWRNEAMTGKPVLLAVRRRP